MLLKEGATILKEAIQIYGPNTTLKQAFESLVSGMYECPECKGKGYIEKETRVPMSGPFLEYTTKREVCKTCQGLGYTREEYVAKTRTIIEYVKK